MKNFLVVRDEHKNTLEVLEFDTTADARKEKLSRRKSGHKGELVLAYGSDLKSFLETFTEYRPENWRELIRKSL
jgi:hypothetical protein